MHSAVLTWISSPTHSLHSFGRLCEDVVGYLVRLKAPPSSTADLAPKYLLARVISAWMTRPNPIVCSYTLLVNPGDEELLEVKVCAGSPSSHIVWGNMQVCR